MIYSWKPTARIKADAQKTGEMCRELENTVGLTPKTLLEANREEGTLLHNEFEWNNDTAAEAYRETQTRDIIRNAVKELNAFKAKYKQLTELQSVFDAIEQIEIMEETA